jgi:hypothetical protein
MRIRAMAALVGLAAPAALASGVWAGAPGEEIRIDGPTLAISRAGLTANAARGSFCASPPAGTVAPGICVDGRYPLSVRGRLPVRPGGRVVLRFDVDVNELQVRLGDVDGATFERIGGPLTVKRLGRLRWAVKLPQRLGTARLLDVFVRWNNSEDGRGDASFWGGIRQECG